MTDCLFCRISLGDIPADIVYQDGDVVAFRDIQPQAPVHILVIPRKHVAGFAETSEEDRELLGRLAQVAAHIATLEGVGQSGFRCVVNSGADAQQSVHHLHMHVLGGRPMSWPPG